jgi:hypothetical protein
MATVTGTKALATEFAGDYKVVKVTFVPESASDVINITAASHGISSIAFVIPKLTAGQDAALAGIFATYSDLAITVVTTAAAGTAATDWTGATAELLIIGK